MPVKQTQIDQWGACGTPKVWRHDTKFLSLNDLQKEETLKQTNEYGNGGKMDGI